MVTCSVNSETKRRSYAVVRVAHITWLVKDHKTPKISSQEYLNQAGPRDNLHVVVCSPVTRILFKDEKSAAGDVVALGVEFVHEGKTYTARANREVILSSG
jgi:hypothetical protein